jgi:zinc protease
MNRAIRHPALWRPALIFALVYWSLYAAAPFAPAQTPDAPCKKGVTIEGITEYQLSNGCRFLLFPDPASSKVTVNMTVLVGSRHEGYGETGMAHLLEHMLFKGSKSFPHIDKSLQAHGAAHSANANTGTDRTIYYESMPAGDDNLEFGIKLEADRLVNSFIRREDLLKEMTVVRNEFEMYENSPEMILSQRMASVAFEWHNYGKAIIGNRSDIERVPIDNLQAFYKKYYQPDNVVVIIAGRFDEAKAIKLMVAEFGALPVPRRKLENTYTEEPPQDGERVVVLRRVGKIAVTGADYHIPATAHDDHPAIEVLSRVLGDRPSGRLYKGLVEKKLATSVTASASAYHDPGLFEIGANVTEEVAPEKVRDAMLQIAESMAANPPTAEEVERAKKRYLAERDQAMTSSQTIAMELSDWEAAGDWRLLFLYRDRIAKVTPEDVRRVAVKYLQQTNRTVGIFYPTAQIARATIPPTPDVATLLKDYKGGEALAEGEGFDPTPANLERRTKRFTLPGGIKVALLPKKTRGEAVSGRIALHFGNAQSLAQFKTAVDYVGPMLMRGTKHHTREQIKDELDALKSSLAASSGLGSLSVGLTSKRAQLPAVLDLLREVLREPAFPQKELDILKASARQDILEGMADPEALAMLSLRRQLAPYPRDHILYVPTYAEDLEFLDKLTRDDVERAYASQLGGQVGEIALVGDFDPAVVTRKLEAIFADWKSSVPYERIAHKVFPSIKGKRETIETPDKENAVYFAGLTFPMRDSDADYPAMAMGNYILGGGGFTSRLVERLRQKEGWSYEAGSALQASSQDPRALFMAYAICNPKVIDKADKGAIEEITKILKDGVTPDELAAARKGYLETMKVARGSDSAIAGMLQGGLHVGRTFAFTADMEAKIAALTVKDVNQALAAHLDPDRLVIVRAGDFKKK